jgi:hypothetical protein
MEQQTWSQKERFTRPSGICDATCSNAGLNRRISQPVVAKTASAPTLSGPASTNSATVTVQWDRDRRLVPFERNRFKAVRSSIA